MVASIRRATWARRPGAIRVRGRGERVQQRGLRASATPAKRCALDAIYRGRTVPSALRKHHDSDQRAGRVCRSRSTACSQRGAHRSRPDKPGRVEQCGPCSTRQRCPLDDVSRPHRFAIFVSVPQIASPCVFRARASTTECRARTNIGWGDNRRARTVSRRRSDTGWATIASTEARSGPVSTTFQPAIPRWCEPADQAELKSWTLVICARRGLGVTGSRAQSQRPCTVCSQYIVPCCRRPTVGSSCSGRLDLCLGSGMEGSC
jgi:hypothetical protein